MSLEDDGLLTPEVHEWSEDKYRLLHNYANLFARSMKAKWQCRVYIDLFAGAGRSRIKESGKIVLTSPLLALGVRDPFDKYIFCEVDAKRFNALDSRLKANYGSMNVRVLRGDANVLIPRILQEIPKPAPNFKVLTFCFADPYKLRNLHFVTIKGLAQRFVDFLILIPTHMDAQRNWKRYQNSANRIVDGFLGRQSWRQNWNQAKKMRKKFSLFIAEAYRQQMKSLGYNYGGLDVLIRSTEKNLPLYRLGFFSRHPRGEQFWNEARKYSQSQGNLFQD